jgi:integrase
MNAERSAVAFEATLTPPEYQPTILPKPKSAPFLKVYDAQGKRIRRLWKRNDRYYAQVNSPGRKNSTKQCLTNDAREPVQTVAEAEAALADLLKRRRNGNLRAAKPTPTLRNWIDEYINWLRRTEAKNPLTISKEASALANWAAKLGGLLLTDLQRTQINGFVAWRKETTGVSNRTINLDVLALASCLRHAKDEGRIGTLPTEGWRPLKHVSPRRPLWTRDQIELVCAKARENGPEGEQLADYLLLLAYSGARRNEGLNLRWNDVDWHRSIVSFTATKYSRPRHVDLNPALAQHLQNLLERRRGTRWLFQCPRNPDCHTAPEAMQRSLERARAAAGLPDFCLHDLRHYFISTCVMAGVDYMTTARWVGHKDGGVLIGKVYGHLNDEHTKKMAARLWSVSAVETRRS